MSGFERASHGGKDRIMHGFIRTTVAVIALALLPAAAGLAPAGARDIRSPVAAGRFYPGEARALEAAVEAYLADALPPRPERPLAMISPHAGYIYSGQICADAFRQASGHDYDVVVIIGPNHRASGFDGVSIHDGDGYRTPLGVAEIDTDLARGLRETDPRFGYTPDAHRHEHSVEVQIPFVQILFPGTPIVTAVMGSRDPGLCADFGHALARVLRGRRPLIVASSDLSHYPAYDDACESDAAVLRAVASLDPDAVRLAVDRQIRRRHPGLSTCACGLGPILAAMTAAADLGATGARVVSYANSGDSAVGDPDEVVGYGAIVLTAGGAPGEDAALARPARAGPQAELSDDDRAALLAIARKTIAQYLESGTTPLARGFSPAVNRLQGAFVTLNKGGRLRGCIGHMAEDAPLGRTVGAMALQAAFHDRRFPSLKAGELPDVEIEISVLTPFRPVPGPEAIVVGRDGVVLRKRGRSAVYLPQVATEQGWNRDQMLDHLCRKAGLEPGDWRRGAELLTFQAEVFSEKERR